LNRAPAAFFSAQTGKCGKPEALQSAKERYKPKVGLRAEIEEKVLLIFLSCPAAESGREKHKKAIFFNTS